MQCIYRISVTLTEINRPFESKREEYTQMNARMHDNPGQRDMYIFFAD